MKSKIRSIVLVILILLIGGFIYFKNFYHAMPLAGQAILSWTASSDSTVKGYKVYYGTSPRNGNCPPGGYAKNLDVGNKVSRTIGNLENGKTYYFSVTSYNSSGRESCFSKEMQKTVSISKWDGLKTFLGLGVK